MNIAVAGGVSGFVKADGELGGEIRGGGGRAELRLGFWWARRRKAARG